MEKIPYFVTGVLIVLTALFAILNKFWTGFVYFVLACLFLLSIFWGVWQIVQYCTTFKQELKEEFKVYKAQRVNAKDVTSENFDANLDLYKKDFNKKMLKNKLIRIFVILFCFAVSLAFLLGMIYY